VSTRLSAAERRHQLVEVALRVFAAQGFHGTSMSDIAVAAGVTKPVLYQHFGSKRQLYAELVTEVGNQLQEVIVKAVASAGSPRQMVERGFAAYFEFVSNHREDHEVSMLALHLLQNCMVYINTLMLQ
jgi:AcrR family transcriptional regulator